MDLLEELEWRGLIKDTTNEEILKELINKKATLYCGFDPTASSLHIGHLVPVLTLKRFQSFGHRVIALVGGGTGLIGDPSGRNSERKLLTLEQSLENADSIKKQLSRFLDFSDPQKTIMLNNYDWLSKIDVITFLRDYGKNFPINYMLAKDTVASRLESGISFTEFSYMIVQSIDFYNLYKKENCRIQLGGSDQWGNITSGAELIRRLDGDTNVVGITMPLITKSDGTKFGKSSGGSFWLDAEMTSPYTIYQYFLNTSDQDVIHYLKVFTFYSKEEIEEFANKVKNSPELREAQKALAKSLVIMLHGEKAMEEVQKMCDVLFGGNIKELSLKQINVCFNGVPSISISEPKNIIDALVEVKAASSKREARELLEKGTYSVNGDKITDANFAFNKQNAIENKVFIIRRGKKNYFMVEIS